MLLLAHPSIGTSGERPEPPENSLKFASAGADTCRMANWTKKLGKAAAGDLEAGERIAVALFLQPAGTTARSIGHGLGGAVGAAIASRSGDAESRDELVTDRGLAAAMPATATVVGITDRRLLVYGHSSLSGKPKQLRLALPLTDLAGVDVTQRKASHEVVLRFADETAAIYEAPRVGNDVETFGATALARATAR